MCCLAGGACASLYPHMCRTLMLPVQRHLLLQIGHTSGNTEHAQMALMALR